MAGCARKVALVVGAGSYPKFEELPSAANEADIVAEDLVNAGFQLLGPDGRLGEEPLINPSKQQLQLAVHNLKRLATSDAVVVFYYSGHGLMCNSTHYMMGVDTELQQDPTATVELYGVQVHSVLAAMQDCYAGIVLLDACRDFQRFTKWSGDWVDWHANLAAVAGNAVSCANLLIFHACHLGTPASAGVSGSPFTRSILKVSVVTR